MLLGSRVFVWVVFFLSMLELPCEIYSCVDHSSALILTLNMFLCLLMICLLNVFGNVQCLTGQVCPRTIVKYETYQAHRYVQRASKYYTSCGFLGLDRCARWRYRQQSEYFPSTRSLTGYKDYCCDGWSVDSSGTNCRIHDRFPEIVSCPQDQELQATGDTVDASWNTPEFKEPFDKGLTITSPYDQPKAELGWGVHEIIYTATSNNNNLAKNCKFTITVLPAVDQLRLVDVSDDGKFYVEEDVPVTIECRADYGKPAFDLKWFLDGEQLTVTDGSTYKTETHPRYGDYTIALLTLQLIPSRTHDGLILTCEGEKGGDMEQVSATLNVKYDPDPVIDFCPSDTTITSFKRLIGVTFQSPQFSDVNNDPLVVDCNYHGTMEMTHGTYSVHCNAENVETHREANCSYNLAIAAASCPDLSPPSNGAVACGYWTSHQVTLCQYLCLSDNDVPSELAPLVPPMMACSLKGNWFPITLAISCTEPKGYYTNMPSSGHYIEDCNEVAAIKKKFKSVVSDSYFKYFCQSEEVCEPDTFSVSCHGN